MMQNCATAEGTSAYASRFDSISGNFRPMLGLSVGSIGIGTYLGESDATTDAAYEEAIRAALLGGVNLIDTAVNYRFQRSERVIGKVLAELIGAGESSARRSLSPPRAATSPSTARCRPIRTHGSRRTMSARVSSAPATWCKVLIA